MTKAEICRKLAEALEPLGSFKWQYDSSDYGRVSPLGYWRIINVSMSKEPEAPWFFDDEDDSARLLEAMPAPRATRDKGRWEVEADWRFFHMDGLHLDRKTAIVLAACKWLGIEIGEITDL